MITFVTSCASTMDNSQHAVGAGVFTVDVPPGCSVRIPTGPPSSSLNSSGNQVRTSDLEGVLHKIKVTRGTAEICGYELAQNKLYEVRAGEASAVTSLVGCTLEIASHYPPSMLQEFPAPHALADKGAVAVANLHARLHALRTKAIQAAESRSSSLEVVSAPRLMIISASPASGRTSFLKTLANYAIRQNHTPLYVDLAVDDPAISIPGTIGAMPIIHAIDPTAGLSLSTVATVVSSVAALPVLYWLGSDHISAAPTASSPQSNLDPGLLYHYMQLVKQLAHAIDARCAQDAKLRASGAFIDVPCGLPISTLIDIVKLFNVTHVLGVVDGPSISDPANHMLLTQLSAALANVYVRPPMAASSLADSAWIGVQPTAGTIAKSSSAVAKSSSMRKYLLIHKIREYFHGARGKSNALTPHHIHVPPSILHMARIEVVDRAALGIESAAQPVESGEPTQILTNGVPDSPADNQMLVQVPVTDGNLLVHSVLALSSVEDEQKTEAVPLATSNVLGFVYMYVAQHLGIMLTCYIVLITTSKRTRLTCLCLFQEGCPVETCCGAQSNG